MKVKEISIDQIGLSVRSVNALHRSGAHTVGDMLVHTEETLRIVRHLGAKSIAEILAKIEEYRGIAEEIVDSPEETQASVLVEGFDPKNPAAKAMVCKTLEKRGIKTAELSYLSAKAYNFLLLSGYEFLHQVLMLSQDELLHLPRIDSHLAWEIEEACAQYLRENGEELYAAAQREQSAHLDFELLRQDSAFRKAAVCYARENDISIERADLSVRATNCLKRGGYTHLSDILFLSEIELFAIRNMGRGSVDEVFSRVEEYFNEHKTRMLSFYVGNESDLFTPEIIRDKILKLYDDISFTGLSLSDIQEKLALPDSVSIESIKQAIGQLIAENELEYVDFRCYRVYGKVADFIASCSSIKERNREMLLRRILGETLEEIGQDYGLTRERIRQIAKRDIGTVRSSYFAQTGKQWFDEDYYAHLYETYGFEKRDGEQWLGIPRTVWNYLDMAGIKRGSKALNQALEDSQLDAGLRLKIKNYINRNKLYIDGRWVEKRFTELTNLVARKFCSVNDVSYDEFAEIYNSFLQGEGLSHDDSLYYTEEIVRSRKNHLADARYILWKQNERLRYYDIDSQDYTELIDELNLESYENIELSTFKFTREHPELMAKYDIRDHYELHNLLRKIIPEGSFHDFHCSKMPHIRFGSFDRDAAIWRILTENAPISATALADKICSEFGYDPAGITMNYLKPFAVYYHQGIYSVDQKSMPQEHMEALQESLVKEFYHFDEIKGIYKSLFSSADEEAINPYTLKSMGFLVFTRYALKGYPSLEAYITELLMKDDITDLKPYKRQFYDVQAFSAKLSELKRNLDVIEFSPDQLINIRKLESGDITKDMLQTFCKEVFSFVDDNTYFNINSIKQDGFASDLFDLDFDDWFYANLLLSDNRFGFCKMLGGIILYKGRETLSIRSFVESIVFSCGSIDCYELISKLNDYYGLKVEMRSDLTQKLQDSVIYYDPILDRFYANAEQYYRELDVV